MTIIKLTRNNVCQWHYLNNVYAKGYFFTPDGQLYKDNDICDYFNDINDENIFKEKLSTLNGIFSIVIEKENKTWVAVDRYRYFPLFYRKKENDWLISDEITELHNENELIELDDEALLTFSGLGYVLGNKTLLKNTFQVLAGEYMVIDSNHLQKKFYHLYLSTIRNISFDEAKNELKNIIASVGKRMSQLLGERKVILPLSAGYDSRLIAYLLKKEGITNVLCYTYGKKEGNPEWKSSKKVAEKLEFQWEFIDYSSINDTQFFKHKKFKDFYTYTAQYVSRFGFTQYFAADYLIDKLNIPLNSVRLPGHGGDFFAGSHLKGYMEKYKSLDTITKDLFYIHCNLVKTNKKERRKIKSSIKSNFLKNIPLFENIENWELKERQSKFIINTNKLWEQKGIDNQIPLCDTELMDFFVSLPFEYRLNKSLYNTTLNELFEEFDICIKQKVVNKNINIIQLSKLKFKRLFPNFRKKNVYSNDFFDLKRIYQPILEELNNSKNKRKILSSNGIFTEWYLLQVKNEMKKHNEKNSK